MVRFTHDELGCGNFGRYEARELTADEGGVHGNVGGWWVRDESVVVNPNPMVVYLRFGHVCYRRF